MQIMILLGIDEKAASSMTKEDGRALYETYSKYTEDLKKAGVFLAGDRLMPSSAGARITAPNGKRTVVDGVERTRGLR